MSISMMCHTHVQVTVRSYLLYCAICTNSRRSTTSGGFLSLMMTHSSGTSILPSVWDLLDLWRVSINCTIRHYLCSKTDRWQKRNLKKKKIWI